MIYQNLTELIGHTPLLEMKGYKARVLLKLERFNPGGSSKDRVALSMIEDAKTAESLSPAPPSSSPPVGTPA